MAFDRQMNSVYTTIISDFYRDRCRRYTKNSREKISDLVPKKRFFQYLKNFSKYLNKIWSQDLEQQKQYTVKISEF